MQTRGKEGRLDVESLSHLRDLYNGGVIGSRSGRPAQKPSARSDEKERSDDRNDRWEEGERVKTS